MAGEEELFEILEDLESQAEAMQHRERLAEVADRAHSEYASVTLDGRLMASLGQVLAVEVLGVGRLRGELTRVGPGWFELRSAAARWWVRSPALVLVLGASSRAVPEVAWSPLHRLGLGTVLRRLADEGEAVVAQLVDGSGHEARVGRVGADFVELLTEEGAQLLVLMERLAALRGRV